MIQNTGTVVRVRYAEAVGANVGAFSSTTETLNSDYSISFNVTAPGAYDLNVTTSLNGAFTIVDDGDGPGTADAGAVTGTQTGGTLAGSLSLTDPGGPVTSGNVAFNRTSSAVISGTSNGSPVTHSLRFTWTASCSSSNGFLTGGDECAVRLGLPVTYSGQSAGDYPGAGNRTQAGDGHFVTISLVSLCGDGVVQGSRGEQCDQGGGFNGTPGSCCTSTCQFRGNGQVFRPSGGVCDPAENVLRVQRHVSGRCEEHGAVPRVGRCVRRGRELVSAGQAALDPVQVSAMSQVPVEGRHTVVAGARASAGQVFLTPSQLSATR